MTQQTFPTEAMNPPDPLGAVLSFGESAARIGLIFGFSIALLTHGAFSYRALVSPFEMYLWASMAREHVHSFLWTTYDIDVVKKPAPEPEKPKPVETQEPKPEELAPKAVLPPKLDEPPPAAAKAGKVLTAPADPGEPPVDFTDGFVTGDGDSYVGGVTAASATGTAATYNPNARPTGVPGGTGSARLAPPPPPKPTANLTRSASVSSNRNWSCPFPPEADVDQVDYATVSLVVTVRPDGTPRSVKVLNDPGHGFARAARQCALSQRYAPALDPAGAAVIGTTPPINVTFTR